MVVEEIDLYWLNAEDLAKYLPEGGCGDAESAMELAQALIDKKLIAVDCDTIDKRMAEAIDGVLSVDIRLPESDPMQQKVPEKLFEYNFPDSDSPIIVTGNSIVTHQILGLILNAAKIKAFVIPVDTMGFTYDNAVAGGNVTPMQVMKALTESGISNKNMSRKMIIGGLGSSLKSSIERITRWSIEIGPISGYELPLYLLKR
jgi:CO dehydrogenase/acetyl-CoA synthase gamma subunit (corrinoid Fe-S protein)